MNENKAINIAAPLTFKQKIYGRKIEFSILIVFVGIFLLYFIGNTKVFSQFNIYYSFMSTIPMTGIIALFMTFVITLGEIDLSFPSVFGLAGWVMATTLMTTGSFTFGILAGLAVGILCGLLNSLLIVKFGIPSIVATIGTQFFFNGIVNVLAQGKGISILAAQNFADSGLYYALVGRIGGKVPAQFIWFIGLGILVWFLFYRHKYGMHVSFVGDNKASALMMGINVSRVRVMAYILVAGFAAFCGMISNMEVVYYYPSQGSGLMLPTLASVFIGGTSVLGGKGSVLGTFLGALIIGSLEAGIIAIGINGFWLNVIYGLILIIAVSIYSFIMKKAT